MAARKVQLKKVRERFSAKWEAVTETGCWLWTASLDTRGYGQIKINGRRALAHRVSWELHNGDIPPGEGHHGTCVLHKCDTPACVNPDHLFLGTHQNNMADMLAKDRAGKKLKEADVHMIRADTRMLKEIAADYEISVPLVSMIKAKKRWAHIET